MALSVRLLCTSKHTKISENILLTLWHRLHLNDFRAGNKHIHTYTHYYYFAGSFQCRQKRRCITRLSLIDPCWAVFCIVRLLWYVSYFKWNWSGGFDSILQMFVRFIFAMSQCYFERPCAAVYWFYSFRPPRKTASINPISKWTLNECDKCCDGIFFASALLLHSIDVKSLERKDKINGQE